MANAPCSLPAQGKLDPNGSAAIADCKFTLQSGRPRVYPDRPSAAESRAQRKGGSGGSPPGSHWAEGLQSAFAIWNCSRAYPTHEQNLASHTRAKPSPPHTSRTDRAVGNLASPLRTCTPASPLWTCELPTRAAPRRFVFAGGDLHSSKSPPANSDCSRGRPRSPRTMSGPSRLI